jgi:hypothetical protein
MIAIVCDSSGTDRQQFDGKSRFTNHPHHDSKVTIDITTVRTQSDLENDAEYLPYSLGWGIAPTDTNQRWISHT